jgi:hypothetical protein
MRAELRNAPWYEGEPSPTLERALSLIADGTWREAAGDFYAERVAKQALGKQAPKGIQRFLNAALDRRFEEAGWIVHDGRFTRERTWIRVTFRHQMSLGSDIVDALRAVGREQMEQAAILAASSDFLRMISPNDHNALVSYEKLAVEVDSLRGCIDIPLVIGRLEPASPLPGDVAKVVYSPRPRDSYEPS